MRDSSERLANEMLDLIPVIMQAMREAIRQERGRDLTVVQFRALGYVRRKPGSSLAELAEHLGLTPPSTSALVEGLVSKGQLLRVEAPGDRRRVDLRLSDAGCEMLDTAISGARASLVKRLEPLTDEQRRIVHEAMQVLSGLYTKEAD